MKNEKRNTADELFLQDPLLDFDSFFNMEETAPPKDPLEDLTFAQILKKLPGTENALQMLELVAHGESEQALVKMRFRGWHELRRLCRALGEMGYLEPVVSLAEAIGRWEGNVEDGFQ